MPKGPTFERDIAKELSQWWTQDDDEQRDDVFWRTAGSGARHTARLKKLIKTHNSAGDLMYLDVIGKPFTDAVVVEMKTGYTSQARITTKAIDEVVKKAHEKDANYTTLAKDIRYYISSRLKKGGDVIDPLNFIDSNGKYVLLDWWLKLEAERKAANRPYSMLIFKRDTKTACCMVGVEFCYFIVDELRGLDTDRCIDINYKAIMNTIIFPYDDFLTQVHPKMFINYWRDRA